MRLADLSVQKLATTYYKCECGAFHGLNCELFFCKNSRIKEILDEKLISYKALFVTDGDINGEVANLFDGAMTLVVKNGDDVMNLFAFPENINLVVAYGGDTAIRNARYFALARNIKCAVVCASADAESIVSKCVRVKVNGKSVNFPAKEPEYVFFNSQNIRKNGLKETYASLAVRTLSLFELKFCESVLSKKRTCENIYELAYEAFFSLMNVADNFNPACALFESSFKWSFAVREGLPVTECEHLFSLVSSEEKYYAYERLTDVYYLFFNYGRKRRYAVADYSARMRAAANGFNLSLFDVNERCYVPTVEELELYSRRFEECRRKLAVGADELKKRRHRILQTYVSFGGTAKDGDFGRLICALPEIAGRYGILSLMRDFGLLEGKNII